MKRTVTATVINGTLRLDESLDLPEHSRVEITIEAESDRVGEPESASDGGAPGSVQRDEPFEQFLKLTQEHPLHLGGRRFTREELHERD